MTKGGLPAPRPGATGLRAAHTREGCDSRSEHSKPGPWGWCRAGDRKQRETPPSPAQWPSRGCGRLAAPGRLPCLAEKAERTEEPGGGRARTAQPRQSQPDGGRRDGTARPGAGLAPRGRSAGLPAPGGDPLWTPRFSHLPPRPRPAHRRVPRCEPGCPPHAAPVAWASTLRLTPLLPSCAEDPGQGRHLPSASAWAPVQATLQELDPPPASAHGCHRHPGPTSPDSSCAFAFSPAPRCA